MTTSRTSRCRPAPSTGAQQEESVDRFVAVLVALLLLSELIAVLGIINTLFLSVYERTRELGLLRTVGMSRGQVRGMIRGESVIIAVIGGVIGVGVGLFWGWAFTRALERQGITEFAVPAGQVLLFLVLSVVAGVDRRAAAGLARRPPRRAGGDRHRVTAFSRLWGAESALCGLEFAGGWYDRRSQLGRLAQGESTSLTRKGSEVQILYRPPRKFCQRITEAFERDLGFEL